MSKLFLSVPISSGQASSSKSSDGVTQMQPKDSEEHSRVGDAMRVLMGKTEMEAEPEKLKQQVVSYIALVREAIAESEDKRTPFGVTSVKLGLTVTVGGNIGLASAEAEASIEIEFSRDAPSN